MADKSEPKQAQEVAPVAATSKAPKSKQQNKQGAHDKNSNSKEEQKNKTENTNVNTPTPSKDAALGNTNKENGDVGNKLDEKAASTEKKAPVTWKKPSNSWKVSVLLVVVLCW